MATLRANKENSFLHHQPRTPSRKDGAVAASGPVAKTFRAGPAATATPTAKLAVLKTTTTPPQAAKTSEGAPPRAVLGGKDRNAHRPAATPGPAKLQHLLPTSTTTTAVRLLHSVAPRPRPSQKMVFVDVDADADAGTGEAWYDREVECIPVAALEPAFTPYADDGDAAVTIADSEDEGEGESVSGAAAGLRDYAREVGAQLAAGADLHSVPPPPLTDTELPQPLPQTQRPLLARTRRVSAAFAARRPTAATARHADKLHAHPHQTHARAGRPRGLPGYMAPTAAAAAKLRAGGGRAAAVRTSTRSIHATGQNRGRGLPGGAAATTRAPVRAPSTTRTLPAAPPSPPGHVSDGELSAGLGLDDIALHLTDDDKLLLDAELLI